VLHERGVHLEAKPFSIGFRIEHPQSLIDRARFGPSAGHPLLGAADYRLVHHAKNGRAVYSFCMCPGGTVVAATSEPERVVTNGMSQYSRNERNANAGIVVGIAPADYALPPSARSKAARSRDGDGVGVGAEHAGGGTLDGIAFQRFWESRAFELGGGGYRAPGQRVGDFCAAAIDGVRQRAAVVPAGRRVRRPRRRRTPGPARLRDRGDPRSVARVRAPDPGIRDGRCRAHRRRDADLGAAAVTRGKDRQGVNVRGLYPAGEGAGYAGGIMSAAVDGIETAEAVALAMLGGAAVRD
jgi:uncharacterized FAD-dependent dehydrogenase